MVLKKKLKAGKRERKGGVGETYRGRERVGKERDGEGG